ncbi:MAG: AI-2E family transporter [Alphaproteobacteria bacterium]|nr:AI-2E family transporter [Alphaproteobacteria bacterium]
MNNIPPPPSLPPLPGNGNTRRLFAWLAIGLMLFLFLHAIRSVLPPFIIGALVGYFLDPVADRLERRGANRTLATAFLLGLFFSALTAACIVMIPLLMRQAGELMNVLPQYLDMLQERYMHEVQAWFRRIEPQQAAALKNAAGDVAGGVMRLGEGVLAGMLASSMQLISLLSLVLITPLVAFYLLRDWDLIVARLDALLPLPYAQTIRARCREIDATLAGFIHGQLTVCITLALYYGLLLTLIGLKFGFVIGMLTGILVVLPYVGFLFGLLVALWVGFIQFGMTMPLALVGAVFAGGQILEGYFLVPRLVGGRVGLHPLWIVFGMLAGGALFGFTGVLLAVPLTAVAGVLIRHATQRYMVSTLYLGQRSITAPPE